MNTRIQEFILFTHFVAIYAYFYKIFINVHESKLIQYYIWGWGGKMYYAVYKQLLSTKCPLWGKSKSRLSLCWPAKKQVSTECSLWCKSWTRNLWLLLLPPRGSGATCATWSHSDWQFFLRLRLLVGAHILIFWKNLFVGLCNIILAVLVLCLWHIFSFQFSPCI